MADVNEIDALKASLRGALTTASSMAVLQEKVEALDPRAEIAGDVLEALGRLSLANAVAAQALRALVETMRSRQAGV